MKPIDKAAEALLPSLVQRHPQALRKMQARAVFASIDTDELARVLLEEYFVELCSPDQIEIAHDIAEAVKAHLLTEEDA